MNKVIEYLNKNRVGQFATIKDGQVVMRPFHFIFEKNGQFIFGTANDKEVFKELKSNPTAGFGVMGADMKWVRIRGKVKFSDSQELKDEMFEFEPLLKSKYGRSENPKFEVFCIYDGVASLHSGGGNLLEEIKF